MFVIGGTPEQNSNRMVEDAFELDPCLDVSYYDRLTHAILAKDALKIKIALQVMADKNINIVGSRGYVYQTQKLVKMIEQYVVEKPIYNLYNVFPRTMGLRRAIHDSITSK